jgi:hypothetical protein
MSGAIPLLRIYAFMAWTGTTLHFTSVLPGKFRVDTSNYVLYNKSETLFWVGGGGGGESVRLRLRYKHLTILLQPVLYLVRIFRSTC